MVEKNRTWYENIEDVKHIKFLPIMIIIIIKKERSSEMQYSWVRCQIFSFLRLDILYSSMFSIGSSVVYTRLILGFSGVLLLVITTSSFSNGKQKSQVSIAIKRIVKKKKKKSISIDLIKVYAIQI